jgi:microtubule-associated protein-like 6
MFRWPSVEERSKHKTYNGHSSHVTKVRFSAGDNYLLSTGGGDCTVFVWKTDFGVDDAIETPTNRAAEYAPHPDDPDNEGNKEDKSRTNKIQTKSDNRAKEQAATRAKVADDEGDFNLDEDMAAGDEFMAIRPWKGAIKEPTGFKRPPANQDKAPQVSIEPEWVYGYRGSMSKNNLGILKDGSMAYFAAGLGISMTAEGDS